MEPLDLSSRVILRVMVLMMIADGVADQEEIKTLGEEFNKISGRNLTPIEIKHEVHAASREDGSTAEFLKKMAPRLEADEKKSVIQAAFLIASADGTISPEEQMIVVGLGRALQMDGMELKAAMDEVLKESS